MVVWHHWYAYSVAANLPKIFEPLVRAGHYGVEIFFVLSGLVLYLPYQNGREFKTGDYLIRRTKRLLPLFYIALFVSAALQWKDPLPFVLFLYPNTDVIGPSFNYPLWSISAEVWFSALLPVFIYLMRWKSTPYVLIVASLICSIGPDWLQASLPGKLYLFLIGMLTAVYLGKVKGSIWCLPLGIIAVYLPEKIGDSMIGVATAGIILYCWVNQQSILTRVLQNRMLQTLGMMCFSIYVWHEPVRGFVGGWSAFSTLQFANWALLAVVSLLSYRFIEFGTERNWRRLFPMRAEEGS
jgi:peptidoglycan/LPS O-acetylase OafA/YrhL